MRTSSAFAAIGVAILMLASGLIGYWAAPGDTAPDDSYYQVSTYSRLNAGHYEGILSVDELLEYGDLGIGTVEGIDGEMIIMDGTAYRAGTDLRPMEVPSGTLIPFAMVTHFDTDAVYAMGGERDYRWLKDYFTDDLPADCFAMAVLMEAEFDSLTIRSVPGQSVPYPPLSDVVANQTTLLLHDVEGFAIGFLMADGLGDINLAGFHLHFISADLSYGGHILDFTTGYCDLKVDYLTSLEVIDPGL